MVSWLGNTRYDYSGDCPGKKEERITLVPLGNHSGSARTSHFAFVRLKSRYKIGLTGTTCQAFLISPKAEGDKRCLNWAITKGLTKLYI